MSQDTISLPSELEGCWTLGSPLGKGGQALAYRLRRRDDRSKSCVIKILRRDRDDPYWRQRMEREIDALLALGDCTGVIDILDYDQAGKSWYTMPLGVVLSTYWSELRDATPIEELYDRSYDIFWSLLQGLKCVHERGLVHRDIKPKNIIVVDGNVRIADFGIVHDPERDRLTTRPATTKFAPHVPSIYDPSHAPKFMDCFALANLWAWMLARDPQAVTANYSWKWHQFVEDERCEIVRATLARCSAEESGPADALEMEQIICHEIGLRSPQAVSVADESIKKVLAAQLRHGAQEQLEIARHESRVESVALSIDTLVESAYRLMEAETAKMADAGVALKLTRAFRTVNGRRVFESVEKAVKSASDRPGTSIPLFSVVTGVDERGSARRSLSLCVSWHRSPHEDKSLASLAVVVGHPNPQVRAVLGQQHVKIRPGGQLVSAHTERVVSPQEIFDILLRLLTNEWLYEG